MPSLRIADGLFDATFDRRQIDAVSRAAIPSAPSLFPLDRRIAICQTAGGNASPGSFRRVLGLDLYIHLASFRPRTQKDS